MRCLFRSRRGCVGTRSLWQTGHDAQDALTDTPIGDTQPARWPKAAHSLKNGAPGNYQASPVMTDAGVCRALVVILDGKLAADTCDGVK